MKDRIKLVMDSLHMGQQHFAKFIGISPASLSSIFNGRTKPTINIVEGIKAKIPNISTEWLVFGSGEMYVDNEGASSTITEVPNNKISEPMLSFSDPSPISIESHSAVRSVERLPQNPSKDLFSEVNKVDKKERKITEIRVFFDDNTWESFSPSK